MILIRLKNKSCDRDHIRLWIFLLRFGHSPGFSVAMLLAGPAMITKIKPRPALEPGSSHAFIFNSCRYFRPFALFTPGHSWSISNKES